MTQLIVLPHVELCPEGAVIEAEEGKSICENLLANDIELDHACEMSCACTTCHVIVREGLNSLNEAEETEEDLLDRAWGLEPKTMPLTPCPMQKKKIKKNGFRNRNLELEILNLKLSCHGNG